MKDRRNLKSEDHSNYSIKIVQKTAKSPGDLRKLSVIQTPIKKKPNQMRVKNSQRGNNNSIYD